MKKLMFALVAVLSLALLGGCVQMYSDTVIEKDGSGKASLKLSISKVVAESMDEMKAAGMDEDGDMDMLDFSKIDEKELKEKAKKHGVKIKKLKKDVVDGRPTLEVNVEFEDLKGLSFVMGGLMGENGGMGIFDNGDGNYVLKTAEYEFEDAWAEEEIEDVEEETTPEEMDPEQMQKQMALMGKLMAASAELEVVMKITTPGDIIESNAPETDGRTSIWTINSSNMMSAGQDMEPNIVFSGKGLKIKALTE